MYYYHLIIIIRKNNRSDTKSKNNSTVLVLALAYSGDHAPLEYTAVHSIVLYIALAIALDNNSLTRNKYHGKVKSDTTQS